MLLKHSGFVPVPKTSFVNIKGGHNLIGDGQQTNQTLAVLRPIEETVRSISDRFNEHAALGPASNVPTFDVESDGEVQEEGDEDE